MNDENRDDREAEQVHGDGTGAGAEHTAPASGLPETGEAGESAVESPTDDLPVISDEELADLLSEAMHASTASDSPATGDEALAEAQAEDAPNPYLDDLLRLQAEYANYRRRTEREKAELGDLATAKAVKQLLPVLDDLGRARAAGDLVEGTAMQVIADKLVAAIERLGVEQYGEKGEPFDPKHHEAIAQVPNPEVEVETIADVVEAGYRIGEIELRPAKVAVFVPAS